MQMVQAAIPVEVDGRMEYRSVTIAVPAQAQVVMQAPTHQVQPQQHQPGGLTAQHMDYAPDQWRGPSAMAHPMGGARSAPGPYGPMTSNAPGLAKRALEGRDGPGGPPNKRPMAGPGPGRPMDGSGSRQIGGSGPRPQQERPHGPMQGLQQAMQSAPNAQNAPLTEKELVRVRMLVAEQMRSIVNVCRDQACAPDIERHGFMLSRCVQAHVHGARLLCANGTYASAHVGPQCLKITLHATHVVMPMSCE